MSATRRRGSDQELPCNQLVGHDRGGEAVSLRSPVPIAYEVQAPAVVLEGFPEGRQEVERLDVHRRADRPHPILRPLEVETIGGNAISLEPALTDVPVD